MIQTGSVGQDHEISFSKVVKAEPRSWEGLNPFTRKMQTHGMPSRRTQRAEHLSAASQIVALAEQEQEYDVSVVSTVPPTHPPLDIGGLKDGTWQSWTGPYHLAICCRVRNSLVRLCYLKSGEDAMFDEDLPRRSWTVFSRIDYRPVRYASRTRGADAIGSNLSMASGSIRGSRTIAWPCSIQT